MMVVKWGRNGRFLACPGYPECKNTKPLEEQEQVETDEVISVSLQWSSKRAAMAAFSPAALIPLPERQTLLLGYTLSGRRLWR